MVTFALDNENNLIVGSELIIKNGNDALVQDIKTRLKMFMGEYPFDNSIYIDYISLIASNNQKDLENAIIAEVKKDTRVLECVLESFSITNSTAKLSLTIHTQSGEVVNV